jgi:hypothetical protein
LPDDDDVVANICPVLVVAGTRELTKRLLQHQKERAAATAFDTTGVATAAEAAVTPTTTPLMTTPLTTERLDAASNTTSVPQLLPVVAQQQYPLRVLTAEHLVLPSNDKVTATLPGSMAQKPQGHSMQSTTAAGPTNAPTNILLLPLLLPSFVSSWNNMAIAVAAGQQLDQDQVSQLLQHQLLLLQHSTGGGFGDQLTTTAAESSAEAAAVVSLPNHHHHVGGASSSCTASSLTTILQHQMYNNSNSCHHHHQSRATTLTRQQPPPPRLQYLPKKFPNDFGSKQC